MAATYVVDASVGISLVSPDEPNHAAAAQTYAALIEGGARFVTTGFYAFEVGNAMARAKHKALAPERFDEARALAILTELPERGLHRALKIAAEGKLSFYDAAYVSLAEELGAVLWTEDKEILKRFPGPSASTAEIRRRLG